MNSSIVITQHEEPDLMIRSIPDHVSFQVKRSHLAGSQIFQDMFACCEPQQMDGNLDSCQQQVVDIPEPANRLGLLLDLLQSPPARVDNPPASNYFGLQLNLEQRAADGDETKDREKEKVIPLPLIPQLLSLADKYMLSSEIVDAIHSHMLVQAPSNPLRVYGLASAMELPRIAATASMYLLSPPLDAYSLDQIRENVPNVGAYHQLVQLQGLRSRRLSEVLMGEPLFPHGYGRCNAHEQSAMLCWEKRRQRIAWGIHAGTDVAHEMAKVMQSFEGCRTCSKAAQAAIDMLAYKCNKCPKRIDQIPV